MLLMHFRLCRLLESADPSVSVTIVNNSQTALSLINSDLPDIVIVDGDLGANDGALCNGPSLVDALLQKYPYLPLIAWSDSEPMREAFSSVFKQHNKPFNEYNTWPKVVSLERILKTHAYHFGEFIGGHSQAFSYYAHAAVR